MTTRQGQTYATCSAFKHVYCAETRSRGQPHFHLPSYLASTQFWEYAPRPPSWMSTIMAIARCPNLFGGSFESLFSYRVIATSCIQIDFETHTVAVHTRSCTAGTQVDGNLCPSTVALPSFLAFARFYLRTSFGHLDALFLHFHHILFLYYSVTGAEQDIR